MPLNKAILAAFKAASRMRGDIRDTYKAQRVLEDASAKLTIQSPRCRIDDTSVKVSDGYDVPLRIFTPLDLGFSLNKGFIKSEDHRGTILFFHGGGWANGDIDFYTDACQNMAIRLERRIVSVDYRRSPEFPFPNAVADCFEVAKELFAGRIVKDADPDNIVLMGDSAGGNLAAVVSLIARDSGAFEPKQQVLLYPMTYNDHSMNTIFPSVIENGDDYILTRDAIEGYLDMYLKSPEDYNNPYFSPMLAKSLKDQPRTLLISAEYCPLRDEGEAYAAMLEADGNEVVCIRMLDAIHGYFLYPTILSLVRDTYSIIKRFLDGEAISDDDKGKWIELLGTN